MKLICLVIVLLPLLASAYTGLRCRKISNEVAHFITTSFVAVSCLFSLWILGLFMFGNEKPFNEDVYTWMDTGYIKVSVGFMVDSLTAMMLVVVTFVSLMVHVYSIAYMKGDPGYNRFFSYISLFTFSMLMLVLSNNFMQLFFGWEAVGLVSYLLIGFWFKKPSATYANMKAFLVNRVGDFGFILGIACVVYMYGGLNYAEVFSAAHAQPAIASKTLHFLGVDWSIITFACIFLFIGAMGKSAQVPLHVWLPDSMEGPTPISALIHAATMVTAGIFMVARMSPLFELSNTALSFVLIIGSITALFMGFLGVIQNDIKRIVAYSTLSQLGYMTAALGLSAYSMGVFHLMTHAFFKALLFLGAGSVIMAMHHNQDIRFMGNLKKYMPITHWTALIGSLSLIGTPFFSGFYSKESIILAAEESHIFGSKFAFMSLLLGVFVTAFYSFRMYFLVFHGKERFKVEAPKHGDDAHHGEHHDPAILEHAPHEQPWTVTLPLVLLAIPSVLIGGMTIKGALNSYFGNAIYVSHSHPVIHHLQEGFHGAIAMGFHALFTVPFWLMLAGVFSAWFVYIKQPELEAKGLAKLESLGILRFLTHKYYFDEINQRIFANGAVKIGNSLWKCVDDKFIDQILVNGSAGLAALAGAQIRKLQTGYLYHSAFIMILGVLAFMTWAIYGLLIG